MNRLQLFEFGDQDWIPDAWRGLLTAHLDFFAQTLEPYRPIAPRLKEILEQLGCRELVDLCSGGGGPALEMQKQLEVKNYPVALTLTDKFPNAEAYRRASAASEGGVRGIESSVDAMDVPAELTGFRTLFTSFHHFPPEAAVRILRDAVAKRVGIGVFEYTERSWAWLVSAPLIPLYMWLMTPFLRPFRWSRLLWTYLIPIFPLMACWDGVVSCLRTYSPEQLRELTAEIRTEGYTWEIGRVRSFGACRITYLFGYPKPRPVGA